MIYYNEDGLSLEDKALKLDFTKQQGPMFRPVNKEGFGGFHVLLRKDNGTWKILMDADTGERDSEENFTKASPAEL
jgi:hypothetical protein